MAEKWAKTFYNSTAWRKLADAYRQSHFHVCERCKKPGAYEVHHIVHLTPDNIKNPRITLNEDNLILLCHECHDREHNRFKKSDNLTRSFAFDKDGNIISVAEPKQTPPLPRRLFRDCPRPAPPLLRKILSFQRPVVYIFERIFMKFLL